MTSIEQLNEFENSARKTQWGIDKKIPVALIFVVALQTLGFTWGAATLSGEVKNNGKTIVSLEKDIEQLSTKIEAQNQKFQTRNDSIRHFTNSREDMNQFKNRLLTVERQIIRK